MKDRALILALLAALCATRVASAEPSAEDKKKAGASFDEGVTRFKRADYGLAAQAFLLADELSPSALALGNAITAGRRAHDDLLVARASQRALSRGGSDETLATIAREALAEASARLAVIDAS